MKKAILTVSTIIFIDLFSFGVIIPILPYYAREFGADSFYWSWIMAIYSIMQLLFIPFWGNLSDKYGRRKIFLISIGLGATSMLLSALATSALFLFITRMFAGIFAANISTAIAFISDNTDEKKRSKAMGIIGAAFGVGFILGPATGGLLSSYGYQTPIFFAAVIGYINWIMAFFLIKEDKNTIEQRKKNSTRRRYTLPIIKETIKNIPTRTIVILTFLSTFAFTQIEVSFAFFVFDRYGWNAKEAGILLAIMGLLSAVIQGSFIGKITKKIGDIKTVGIGYPVMLIGFFLTPYTYRVTVFYIGIAFTAIGYALVHPILISLMSKLSHKDKLGAMIGVNQSASALARATGPIFAGYMYLYYGMESPFYFAAMLSFLCLNILLAYRYYLSK